jgi:hypothetical protein
VGLLPRDVDHGEEQTEPMPIAQWWPRLQQQTRDWLIANNGDVVPPAVMAEIAEAGGPTTSDSWWVAQDEEATGRVMPDEAIDWIEETANEEPPYKS